MRSSSCLIFLFLLMGFGPCAVAAEVGGLARVVDGDTLVVGERTLRLSGINAWELGQNCSDEGGASFPCGMEAAVFLKSMVEGEVVWCVVYTSGGDGGMVSRCYQDGRDLAEEMVAQGWAVAQGGLASRYAMAEKTARMSHRGGWRKRKAP